MRRPILPFVTLLCAGVLASSCLGTDTTGVPGDGWASIAINPALIPSPADAGARPINRIRAVAVRVADNAEHGRTEIDVNPAAAEWVVNLNVRLTVPSLDVSVFVYLLHVEGGTESVEFSGVVGPLTVRAGGAPLRPADIPLVRGPIANFYVTGISVQSAPDTMLEGRSSVLGAATTTSTSATPRAYWTVLDSAILSVSDSVVTALVPGVGRVVASAGAFTDTTSIVVRPAPASVAISPDTSTVAGVGAQASYQAAVIDVRGDTIQGEAIAWRSATPSVISSLGGGTFQALAAGTGTVEAYGVSDPLVVGQAVMIVGSAGGPANVDLEILKTVDQLQPLSGDTVQFTVSVVNRGPVTATNIAVFDTLAAVFTGPLHSASVGSLVGDSLWTIPSLGVGFTATWTTTATVAAGAGGGSATNTATLRSLAENDTTSGNNTATVAMTFPLSAVPTVQITQPADSAVFDPGDLVTFIAAASDPEDGDLSSQIQWMSSIDGVLGTGRTIGTSTLKAGVHTISASATDSDGGVGADTVHVTVALYTVPATLNVPFGGTASLPITLSQPAPAGGVTLSVSSDNPSVTAPSASTVSIAAGALSANATLSGIIPGAANVTVGNPQYGSATTAVAVTAALNILGGNVSFATPFTETITVQFESQGTPIAAPAGGLPVTLQSRDPSCVTVSSPITIPAGQINRTATLSYGGSATPTCQTYVDAVATNVGPDSVLVSVTAATTISVQARTVASGLQDAVSGTMGVANHGGVTLTLTSSDPNTLLVSPNATTAGAASIDMQIPNGTNSYSFYVQGVEGATGTATVTATATGFNEGAGTMTVVQPGLTLVGLTPTTTTLSADDAFYAFVGVPAGGSVSVQNVRAGGSPVTVTFDVDDTGVALLTDGNTSGASVTATIPVGLYYSPTTVATGGVAFDPVGVGTATVSASAPGIITQTGGTQVVTVSAPTISVNARTVGSGLQLASGGSMGATQHGGVTLTLTSSDPNTLLVSPDASTAGTASIDLQIPDGTNGYTFSVQGVEGATGTATVTATATGFNQGVATMTVVQPGIVLVGLNSTLTTLSPNDDFYAYVGIPAGGSVSAQSVRAGGSPITATFDTDDTAVGLLTDGTVSGASVTAVIAVGLYYTPTSVATGGVAHDPVGAGTATVSVSAPGFVTPTGATQSVTVTAPTISVNARTVASGLQESSGGAMGATQHGGVTLTLTSSDPNTLLVSPDAATAGTASIDLQIPDGTNGYSFWVQGVEGAIGTATVTATATGFNQGVATMTVVQPGIILAGLNSTMTTLSPDDDFYAFVGVPAGNSVNAQSVRAGGSPITVTFDTDNVGVGLLTDGNVSGASVTATIATGLYYTPTSLATGGVAHNPVGTGTATISASAPGVVTQPAGTQVVTVSAPMITLTSRTVGSGLQVNDGGSMGATQHGGVTLTLTSSDPNTMLVSPSATTPGTASIDLQIPDGTNGFSFYVQGVEGATGTVTLSATANGFLDGTTTITVVQPGIAVTGIPASLAQGAPNDDFYAFIGTPSGNSVSAQNVRAGAGALTVTVTTSSAAVAQLATQSGTGASVTAVIQPGLYYTPTTFATGGFALDPLTPGQTTVSVSAVGYVTQPSGTVAVTITP